MPPKAEKGRLPPVEVQPTYYVMPVFFTLVPMYVLPPYYPAVLPYVAPAYYPALPQYNREFYLAKARKIHIDRQIKKAEKSYTRALDHYELGEWTEYTQKIQQAFRSYRFLADKGNLLAREMVSKLLKLPACEAVDEEISFDILKSKAEQGNAELQFKVAYHYELFKKDRSQAMHWYRLAAYQNYRGANEAFIQCLEGEADEGKAAAQYELGRRYERGEWVGQSRAEAIKWYKLAAEQSNVEAISRLSVMISLYQAGGNISEADDISNFLTGININNASTLVLDFDNHHSLKECKESASIQKYFSLPFFPTLDSLSKNKNLLEKQKSAEWASKIRQEEEVVLLHSSENFSLDKR